MKIILSDKFMLNEAVLEKEMTVEIRPASSVYDQYCIIRDLPDFINAGKEVPDLHSFALGRAKYYVGQMLTLMQSYRTAEVETVTDGTKTVPAAMTPGWSDKRKAKEEFMPHHIEITKVDFKRLSEFTEDEMRHCGIIHSLIGAEDIETGEQGDFTFAVANLRNGTLKLSYTVFTKVEDAFQAYVKCRFGNAVLKENPYMYLYHFKLIN